MCVLSTVLTMEKCKLKRSRDSEQACVEEQWLFGLWCFKAGHGEQRTVKRKRKLVKRPGVEGYKKRGKENRKGIF